MTPAPLRRERDPNEELGYLLRTYQRHHRQGKSLDATVPEEDVILGDNRRRVDRAIWCGLGRLPQRGEVPTICVEFVSAGRRSQIRNYLEKRGEYKRGGVSEYWIIDRFARQLQVTRVGCADDEHLIIIAGGSYETDRLPGFTLRLDESLAVADRWEGV